MVEHSECKCCKTWEEEIYWKHFTSMHFFHTLPPDFHDHLVLPEKFTAHMKSLLPDKVSLKGPSGALWDIELLKSDELLFVGDGWREFVNDNGLKENFVLMFKFKRNSSFEVLIFDQENSCENEAAYFVRKCRHSKSCHENLKNRTAREASSTEVLEDVDEEDLSFVTSKKSKRHDEVEGFSGKKVSTQAPRTCEEDFPLVVSKKSKKENVKVGYSIGNVSNQAPRTRIEDSALLLSKKSKKADEVGSPGANVSCQDPRTYEKDSAFIVSKEFRKDDDESVGCSVGKVSTQAPRTLEDVALVVSQKSKKNDEVVGCSGGKVNTQTPRTHKEDSPLLDVSKESKKDGEAMGCSGGKVNTQVLRKQVLYVVERGKWRSRASPLQSPGKPRFYYRKKSIRNDTAKELGQISETDVVIPENVENFPEKDNYDKLESQFEKSLKKNDAAKELSQSSRKELITPQNSPFVDHSREEKGQSEEQPSENHISNEPTLISKMVFITTGNGENFKSVVHSPALVPQSEKRPRSDGTSKNLSKIFQDEQINPKNDEKSPITDCSQGFKEKAQSGNGGAVKRPSQISGREKPNYGESSSEEALSCKSGGKRVSNGRRGPMEFMSKRRPITDIEKEDTFNRANQKLTENGFLAVMRPTSVYKRFFLSVPAKWTHKHLRRQNQEAVLRVGRRTWHTTLVTYAYSGAGISSGWKKFALDNFLEEFDVLVFNPVSMKGGATVVMNVDIFRVVQDIVPPLPIDS